MKFQSHPAPVIGESSEIFTGQFFAKNHLCDIANILPVVS